MKNDVAAQAIEISICRVAVAPMKTPSIIKPTIPQAGIKIA